VQIVNPKRLVLPGMYAEIRFVLNRVNPPLIVPATALLPLTDGVHVIEVGPDGRVQHRKLRIVRDYGDYMEVDGGVSEGESVVLNPGDDLPDGTTVRAVERVVPNDSATGETSGRNGSKAASGRRPFRGPSIRNVGGYVVAPAGDSASKIADSGESRVLQEPYGAGAPDPALAHHDDLPCGVEGREGLRHLPQRDEPRPVDAGDLVFLRLAYVDEIEVVAL